MRAYCKHDGEYREVRIQVANGHWQVRTQCLKCNEVYGPARGNHRADFKQLPIGEWSYLNPACAVCGEKFTAYHHWLPRALAKMAGESCEAWPGAYLCEYHHRLWHQIVTPGLVPAFEDNGHKEQL